MVPKKSSTNFWTVPLVDNNLVRKISGIDLCVRLFVAAAEIKKKGYISLHIHIKDCKNCWKYFVYHLKVKFEGSLV